MILDKPKIFSNFPEIAFGLSTKVNLNSRDRFNFNMSKSIGDDKELVLSNRAQLFKKLGLNLDCVIVQKQTHSDIVNVVDKFTKDLEGDALITKSENLGLAISTADCTNIYLYDSENKVIAAVHSGWMGTEKKILEKTLKILTDKFNSNPENIFAYFGPSICQKSYEVGEEFKKKFDGKYMLPKNEKLLLDLKAVNKDMLLSNGIMKEHIEIDDICSFDNKNFHSYRRDKENSGRALGVIAIMEKL
jgi:YfiH family protein